MCQGIIYKATNLINSKCYIGQTTNELKERKRGHLKDTKKGCTIYFHRAIRKYGVENFKWEIIYECEDKLVLNLMETFKIMTNHSHRSEGGYNLTWGGEDNPMNDPIIRKKMGESQKGRRHSDETKRKIGEASKGRKPTEETKRKMSEKRKGRKHTEETKRKISEAQKGEKGNMYGKHPTEETRRKISEAGKGRKPTEETKRKLSESKKGEKNGFYGKHHTEETKRKLSESQKGENNHNYGKHRTEEIRRKISEAYKMQQDGMRSLNMML